MPMVSYQRFCQSMSWGTATHFVTVLNKIIPMDQAKIFLVSPSSHEDAEIFEVIIMDDYKFLEGRFVSANIEQKPSTVNIKVHLRADVASREVDLGEFRAFPLSGYTDKHISINFKDRRDPIHISAQQFNLSQEDFLDVVSLLTR